MFSFRRHTDKRNGLNIDTREITLEPADNARLLSLCGPFDDNIKQLERRLGIEINRRDNHFKLTGRPICVTAAADILRSLYVDTAPMRGQIQDIEPEQIHLAIKEARVLEQSAESVPEYGKAVNIKTKRGVIKPRTPNQAQYIANILDHDITFGVGPAGTGKTYLAVAAAVDALERQEIRRILLTRPAVEAGEKLGFLPGDLSQKVDPYLRPLYDALFEMLGFEKVEKLIERNVIEVAPLAYMRGRTLNDAFIILDESQNTTIEQMKMFLTRIGFNSKGLSPATSHRLTCRVILNQAYVTPSKCWPMSKRSALTSSTAKTWFVTLWWRVSLTPMKPGKKPNKNEKRRWRQNASAKNRNKNESGDPRFTTGM